MGSFSIFHIVILVAFLAVFLVPVWKILNKAGFSGWWSLLYFVPLVGFVMLWVFAFTDWPALTPKVCETRKP